MGEDVKKRNSKMLCVQKKVQSGGFKMNMEEALKIARREMGLNEIPMDHETRRKVAARVFELCRTDREPPRLTKLEEF
jgi:hypothetical protein